MRRLGVHVVCCDLQQDSPTNLLDQDVWEQLFTHRIAKGEFAAMFATPPWKTFCDSDDGLKPLRGPCVPDLLGFPGLTPMEKASVREETALSLRVLEAAEWFALQGLPWGIGFPAKKEGRPSLFDFPEAVRLKCHCNTQLIRVSQCLYGCQFKWDTDFLVNFQWIGSPGLCNHPPRWWKIPWSGEAAWGPHPPLKGCQVALPAEEWRPHMKEKLEPEGPLLFRSLVRFPAALNVSLADAFASACRQGLKAAGVLHQAAQEQNKRVLQDDLDFCKLPKTRRVLCLGRAPTNPTVEPHVGGLRRTFESVEAVPGLVNLGVQIRNFLDSCLDKNPELEDRLLASLGKPKGAFLTPAAWLDDVRCGLVSILLRAVGESACPEKIKSLTGPVSNRRCQTVLRAGIFDLWARAAQDPGAKIVPWLTDGAPGGILLHPELDGLFPKVTEEEEFERLDPEGLWTDLDQFANYEGIESNEAARETIQGYADAGFLKVCDSLDECRKYLGAEPVVSKLGCITKVKTLQGGSRVTKHRIILDAKRSLVTASTSRRYKSVLPRATDVVWDALELQSDALPGEITTLLVADVENAFWLLPLAPSERRFFVAKLRGKYFVFLRTAQGSRSAPLTFAAVMALSARLVQSVLLRDRLSRRHPQEGRLEVYVDDPIAVLSGTPSKVRRLASLVLVTWMVLGFPLALHKACFGSCVVWVGVQISVSSDQVEVQVPQDKIEDLMNICADSGRSNVLTVKALRSLAGKVNNVATVLFTWRPFAAQLFAALRTAGQFGAPQHCIWTKQVHTALSWLLAFLARQQGTLRRVWLLEAFMARADRIQITWDASPFGFGATLSLNGKLVTYLHDTVQDFEKKPP